MVTKLDLRYFKLTGRFEQFTHYLFKI